MMRRNAETIRELVAMLRATIDECGVWKADAETWRWACEREREELSKARARIAELEARPAAPSLEEVADALVWHSHTLGASYSGILMKLFGCDRDKASDAYRKARERQVNAEDDGA